MYVIFPLDELLDLNSARGNKRGRATLDKQSHTRHTEVEVLPLSQPNQQLPNQLKPPLSQPPKSRKQSTTSIKPLTTPTPPQQKQQQPQPQPPQSQKPTLTKTPSKSSLAVSPPSIVVPPQSPVSVPTSNQASNVKKAPPTQQQTVQPPPPPPSPSPSPQPPPPQPQPPQPPPPIPAQDKNKRQRSSHSTSTETSSTSSTGAKGKALLSPQASGGATAVAAAAVVTNRSSWGGTTAGPFQESCPARSGSFKAFKDITVSGEGNSLKVVDHPSAAETTLQEVRGSTRNVKPPLNKSNSFRSHLSDSCAQRPRHLGVEALKKPQGSSSLASIPTQQQQGSPLPPVESPRKPSQELSEQPLHSSSPAQTEPKGSETVVTKQEIPLQAIKEKQTPGLEGIKIKQEVPVQAPPPSPSHHQISAAESLRIQQECLSPPAQRHPSGRSNRSSGSQKLSDLPPSGSGGGSRGASGSANLKNQGVQGGPPRGLLQQQRIPTVMATNESSFRDLTNPNVNESLKAHNAFTFKLVKTGPSSGALEESQSPDETLDHQS